MMTVIRHIEGLGQLTGPLHLAIGVFDGVHLGHVAVIESALHHARQAEPHGQVVVVTFDPHPAQVLGSGDAPKLLVSPGHKLALLRRQLGIRAVLEIPFDEEFAAREGSEFVEQLVRCASGGIASISVGEDWKFGRKRSGDLALLHQLGKTHGFEVSGVPTVSVDGWRVSSTLIRASVEKGDLATATRLLGRPYSVFGTVVQGRQLGRTLGFPTANLEVGSEQLPPDGVYAVKVFSGDGTEARDGVANQGCRPTVAEGPPARVLEVHLLDFSGDLYDQPVEVEFGAFLRPEQKFDGLEVLRTQIARDVEAARRFHAVGKA